MANQFYVYQITTMNKRYKSTYYNQYIHIVSDICKVCKSNRTKNAYQNQIKHLYTYSTQLSYSLFTDNQEKKPR